MKILLFLLFVILSFSVSAQSDYAVLYDSARGEYASGNYKKYLNLLQQADSIRPNHPVIIYRLAGALALNDQMEQCSTELKKSLMLNAELPVETDPDPTDFRETAKYDHILYIKDSLLTPCGKFKPCV